MRDKKQMALQDEIAALKQHIADLEQRVADVEAHRITEQRVTEVAYSLLVSAFENIVAAQGRRPWPPPHLLPGKGNGHD